MKQTAYTTTKETYLLSNMTDIQKAIINYRKTWVRGKQGGTVKALAELCHVSPRTIYYWLEGDTRFLWTDIHVEKISQATLQRTHGQYFCSYTVFTTVSYGIHMAVLDPICRSRWLCGIHLLFPSVMLAYPKPTKKKLSSYQKAKQGLIQQTLPEEKKKALERDNHQCISCSSRSSLTFSHCYWHNSEVIRDETRNLYYRGCILCLKCHERIPKEPRFDYFCKQYVWARHPDIYYL